MSVPDPGTLKPVSSPRPQPSPALPSPRARTKASPAASDYLVPPDGSAPTVTRRPTASFSTQLLIGAAIVGALGVSAGLLVLLLNRRANEKSLSEQMLDPQPAQPGARRKTWEQEVAEKLRRANGSPPQTKKTGDSVESSPDASFQSAPPPPVVDELTLELLRQLEWKRFELIVQRYYGATGLRAECTCIGPDGGVDVKLFRTNEERPYCFVQCKAWSSEKVKLTTMREFLGVMTDAKIAEGIFITTSDFRREARTFAAANGIATLTAADFIPGSISCRSLLAERFWRTLALAITRRPVVRVAIARWCGGTLKSPSGAARTIRAAAPARSIRGQRHEKDHGASRGVAGVLRASLRAEPLRRTRSGRPGS